MPGTQSPSTPPRAAQDRAVIIVGFDAMDIGLIERWADEGHLPAFAALRKQAAGGRLGTSSAVLQASVWGTLATGCSPGKHGRYYMLQMRPGKAQVAKVRAEHCFREPFWAFLEPEDGRLCVVDVPLCVPALRISGLQIVEWGAFDHMWGYATSPTDRMEEVMRRFGDHPLRKRHTPPRTLRQYKRFAVRLVRGIDMKHRLNMGLLADGPWRLFVSVFGEPHACGHYYWRHHDPSHPEHDPGLARHVGTALRDVYVAVDAAVGELVDRYGNDYAILLVSGHGIGPGYHPHHLLPEVLRRMGVTVAPAPGARSAQRAEPLSYKRALLRRARGLVPPGLRAALNRCLLVPRSVRDEMMVQNALAGVDMRRSRAFCLPTDLQGYVRVNLAGREPTGTVRPGADYDAVCDEIERELLSLRNADTGGQVVERVVRTHQAYAGADHLEQLPDLCVLWNASSPVSAVESPRYGLIAGAPIRKGRSGSHRPDAFVFATGKRVPAGPRQVTGDILDVAPTVFRLLGKPPLADWDGKPLGGIFT